MVRLARVAFMVQAVAAAVTLDLIMFRAQMARRVSL
jgi:hypothetical protein